MELDELKSAWSKFTSDEVQKRSVSEQEVNTLLTNRTRDITEKIGRNIRVGVGIILAWVVLGLIINLILSPVLDKVLDTPYMTDEILFWTSFIEIANYLLIFATILIFWIRYSRIEKLTIDNANLKDTLTRLIGIVTSYKRMFYVVMVIVLFYIAVSFSSGFFLETNYRMEETGLNLSELTLKGWTIMISAFTITLGLVVVTYYLLFNFFFKRLYGRYLKKMTETLKELDEVNI